MDKDILPIVCLWWLQGTMYLHLQIAILERNSHIHHACITGHRSKLFWRSTTFTCPVSYLLRLVTGLSSSFDEQAIMSKRGLEDDSSTHKAKKIKFAGEGKVEAKDKPILLSNLTSEEIDFPRGGGTSFTPIEVKAIRAEALQEANIELFEVCKVYSSYTTSDFLFW